MLFDLDAARSGYEPWDLSIQIDGVAHPVREITVEEFARIQSGVVSAGSPAETELLASLFPQTKPDVAAWDTFTRDEVSSAITAYLAAHLEKKRQRIRAMINSAAAGTRRAAST